MLSTSNSKFLSVALIATLLQVCSATNLYLQCTGTANSKVFGGQGDKRCFNLQNYYECDLLMKGEGGTCYAFDGLDCTGNTCYTVGDNVSTCGHNKRSFSCA
ncbi:hypothetical protein BGZ97_011147 [Linnemannia gamsii]|uniref:Uncharacterized protein n=1 Tax=Linnemannia gamsii TaxID=64522 RepID=A0A9P6R4T1_9FUNG|nr:hypothetical protein BGZ97_011147 [Linnemannia gamsii]